MPDAVATITTAISMIKRISDLSKKVASVELREQIVELRTSLVDAKEQVVALQERNLDLEAAIRELETGGDAEVDIEFKDGLYFRVTPKTGLPDGPFCPRCYDRDGALMVLSTAPPVMAHDFGKYMCPECDKFFSEAGRGS